MRARGSKRQNRKTAYRQGQRDAVLAYDQRMRRVAVRLMGRWAARAGMVTLGGGLVVWALLEARRVGVL